MKFSKFFAAAALIAGVVFSAKADAVSYTDTYSDVSVSSGTYATETLLANRLTSGFTGYNFSESGTLAAHTAVTFTYAATNVFAQSYFEFVTGTLDGATESISFDGDALSPLVVGALPLLVEASYAGTGIVAPLGALSGRITLQNLSSVAVDFGAYFKSVVLGDNSQLTVTAITSSIPLPPAVLLFGTALVGTGLARFRKVRKGA